MSVAPWPDHLMTLDEWDALPEDGVRRYELVEGVLVVVPRPAPLHQRAMYRLTAELDAQLPDDLTALPDVEVIVDARHPITLRAPDVVVTSEHVAQQNPARLDPRDVLAAVEIISPGTKRTDEVTKFAEYAEAGIEHYWLVDLTEPAMITVYRLIDDQYEIIAKAAEPITLLTPAQLEIDPARLVRRR